MTWCTSISGAVIAAILLAGAPSDSRAQPAAATNVTSSDWVAVEWAQTPLPATPQDAANLEATRAAFTDAEQWEEAIPIVAGLVRWAANDRGADDPMTIERVLWLAYAERRTGAWVASERHYEMALASLERTHRESLVLYRTARDRLLDLYIDKGDWGSAEPIARALVQKAQADAPDTTPVAEALRSLASVRRAQGAFSEADALLRRALSIVKAHGEPAQIGYQAGDVPEKDRSFESKTRKDEAAILRDLTMISLDLSMLDEAERFARAALFATEETNGPESMNAAITRHDLGSVFVARGKGADAWAEFTRSLALRKVQGGATHPSIATVQHSMARLRIAEGRGAEAQALAQSALPILEASNGPRHRRVADVLEDIAESLVIQGRASDALPFEDRGADIRDRDAAVVLAVGSEAQKRLLLARRRKHRDAALTIAAAADEAGALLGLRIVLHDKGRLADLSTSEMAALRGRLDDAGRATLDELAQVTAAISSAVIQGETVTIGARARQRLDRLEARRQLLSGRIGNASAAFRADEPSLTVDDVARRLPGDAALVEIVQRRPLLLPTAPTDATTTVWGAPRYTAYVLSRGHVGSADLGSAADVDRAVAALRGALTASDLTRDPKPAARAAYDAIFTKIEPLLGGASHVVWSPDGALSLLPVGALAGVDGRYLTERLLITYLASGRDVVRIDDPREPKSGPIVIGAPDFGALPGAPSTEKTRAIAADIDMRRIGFLPLPGTAREATAVGSALSAKAVLTGDQATESVVKWAHAPSVLHVATHGFFLPTTASDLSPDVELTGSERTAALAAESPLVRSGLAFAGANQRASGTEDGILTGLEASNLDLFGTELVVLSACETGVGVATSGDGVQGLRRAFAVAGAETLVMSLWEVDSGRTRELMTSYYEALAAGAGRSEAMRRTELAMLANKATSHPFYWASFIVSGSWHPLHAVSGGALGRVDPSPRGCACVFAGETERTGLPGRSATTIMGIAIAASCVRRMRRRRFSR
ncbi:MAG: CHAT domain-containing tetratricopeptide repeat protein [Polyangiaceae bacterium]